MRLFLAWALCPLCALWAADPVLRPGTLTFDRPTLTSLGLVLPFTGDDNENSAVSVRYKKAGATTWVSALPLYRVHPETIKNYVISTQFAGSLLDLRPATSYDIEVTITDPDGGNQVINTTGTTRAIPPSNPQTPRIIPVSSKTGLETAMSQARAGDVISLADGIYVGQFFVSAAGTAENPIILRGSSRDGTILDGSYCLDCNVLEVYGSGYVHIERLTIRNASRAIRFQTAGAQRNVVRRVRVTNVDMGIEGRDGQFDFYIADNTIEGRIRWPQTCDDDGCARNDLMGISVRGFGHAVAHNYVTGFGDSLKTAQRGARAIDFYGNDIRASYDNAVELDGAEGNVRFFRNRILNAFMGISTQPVHAGPAYVYRNVVINSVVEQIKSHLHATNPPEEPNGTFVLNNTFVSPYLASSMQGGNPTYFLTMLNNLFVGPTQLQYGYLIDWTGTQNRSVFDYNGYYPDGAVLLDRVSAPSFAAFKAASGRETNGFLVPPAVFANGKVGPTTHTIEVQPEDWSLSASSAAKDRAKALANINEAFTGAGPDLGALESGCPIPVYGPRLEGVNESNQTWGCTLYDWQGPGATIAATTTVIATPQTSILYTGTATSFPVTITVSSASAAVTGSAILFVNGSPLVTLPLSGGQAFYQVPVAAGLAAGSTVTVQATFPGSSGFASSVSNSLPVRLGRFRPVVTWQRPQAIPVGTPLSSLQLNAAANVPGTFRYLPPAGTRLGRGANQPLWVIFTPTDRVSYETVTAYTYITVN